MNDSLHIFSSAKQENISLETLQKYLNDELSPREQQQLEKQLLENDMYADALDGLKEVKQPQHLPFQMDQLRADAQKLIPHQQPLSSSNTNKLGFRQYAVAAAIFLLLLTSIFVIQDIYQTPTGTASEQAISMNKNDKEDADIATEEPTNNTTPNTNKPTATEGIAEDDMSSGFITSGPNKQSRNEPTAFLDVEEPLGIIEEMPEEEAEIIQHDEVEAEAVDEEMILDELADTKPAASQPVIATADPIYENRAKDEMKESERIQKIKNREEAKKKLQEEQLALSAQKIQAVQESAAPQRANSGADFSFDDDFGGEAFEAEEESAPVQLMQRGIESYNAADYNEAINFLERALKQTPSNDRARLMLGLSYIANQRARKAIPELEKLVKKGASSDYYHPAKFNLAKAWIQQNNKRNAIKLLQEIIDEEGEFKGEAIRLLNDLE